MTGKQQMYHKKEELGNYCPVSFISVLGMSIEHILLKVMSKVSKDKTAVRHSQHEFIKRKFYLRKLTSFHDEMPCSVDKGKAMDIAYLDFNKTY
ncbi:mitochondrial enolase superfamily member 1 [Grus japonensis]|uniref:Mitochondrial enolase superfamily member 1 n=1 Tax=Grus japonensis TaxID=30415 RepID=A0ABC9Y6U0_GRUJA